MSCAALEEKHSRNWLIDWFICGERLIMRQASHCSNTYSIHKQTVSSQTFKKSRAHNVVTYLVAFELSPRCFMGQFRTFPLCFHFGKFSFQALDTTPVAFRGGTKLREKQEARLRILQVFRCPLFSPLRPLTPLTFIVYQNWYFCPTTVLVSPALDFYGCH